MPGYFSSYLVKKIVFQRYVLNKRRLRAYGRSKSLCVLLWEGFVVRDLLDMFSHINIAGCELYFFPWYFPLSFLSL